MARRGKVLKGPYQAYNRLPVTDVDEELVRVGRGTPCGEYLRRFWQPVALSSQLGDVPRAIRIMGEDLVVFRDGGGRIGILERACCHRGTSLEFGKIDERGIRCCYHAWQFDIDGTILDTPGEPADSTLRHKIRQGAYPAHEWKGVIFAYMGPPEKKPPFPIYDAFEREEADFVHRYRHSPCNWLQVRENETDPLHLCYLHTRLFGVQFQPVYGEIPAMEWMETPHGMIYITTRRWGENLYIRTNDMLMPNAVRVGGIDDAEEPTLFDRRGSALNWVVPVDDTNSLNIGFGDIDKDLVIEGSNAYPDRMNRDGAYTVGAGDVGQTGEPSYEERQRAPGDWDAWVSQGPITIHGREHLAASDRGITMYRRLVRSGIRAVARGEDPKGLVRDEGAMPIPTYCHNTVRRVPAGPTPEADHEVMLAFGREITEKIMSGEITKERIGSAPIPA